MFSLNRRLSRPLTGLLLRTPVHPNHLTLLSGLAGLAAAFCFASQQALAGALLFQGQALLDNCDGEVARARQLTSRLGSWLDTVTDLVVQVLLLAGITIGYASGASFGAGIFATTVLLLVFLLTLKQKREGAGPSLPKAAGEATAERLARALVDLDFSVLLLILTLAGALPLFLWLAALVLPLFLALLVRNELACRRLPG